jgi:hypothetical protein
MHNIISNFRASNVGTTLLRMFYSISLGGGSICEEKDL